MGQENVSGVEVIQTDNGAVTISDNTSMVNLGEDYLEIILPPINLNQFRIYKDSEGKPIGFLAWGNFSEEIERKYLDGQMIFSQKEWNSGAKMYMTEFIAPFGHAKQIIHDLTNNVFPDGEAFAIRYKELGKPKKNILKFYGVNKRVLGTL